MTAIGGFGVLEAATRLMNLAPHAYVLSVHGRESPLQISSNSRLGYEYRPGFIPTHGDRATPQTNSHGLRDRERTLARQSPMIRRVAIVGDSVIDGNFSEALFDSTLGIFDYRDTIPARIEALLGSARYEVFNVGVNGYCLLNEVELIRTKLLQFKPDLVVLNFVDNDLDGCFSMLGNVPERRPLVLEWLVRNSAWVRFLEVRFSIFGFVKSVDFDPRVDPVDCADQSVLCEKMKEASKYFLGGRPSEDPLLSLSSVRMRQLFAYLNHPAQLVRTKEFRARWGGASRAVEELAELKLMSDKNRFRLLVTIWPRFLDDKIVDIDTDGRVRGAEDQTPLLIERWSRRLGIKTLRLSGPLRMKATSARPSREFTVGDGMHPDTNGAKLAAEVFRDIILREFDGPKRN